MKWFLVLLQAFLLAYLVCPNPVLAEVANMNVGMVADSALVSTSAPLPVTVVSGGSSDASVVDQNTTLGTTKNQMVAGSVSASAPTYVAGKIQPISLTTTGAVRVDNSATASAQTYMASTGRFTVAATPTDMVAIGGSASKTVKILRIVSYSIQTTSGEAPLFLIKRSTADSGGTGVADTVVPMLSTNNAASWTLTHYTANPTTGNAVGTVSHVMEMVPTATALDGGRRRVLYECAPNAQPITLVGTSQQLCINGNGAALGGGNSYDFEVTATEE